MPDLIVITGQGSSLGFRTAGLETLEADEKTDMSNLLLGLQAQGRYGLIAIEERFLEKVSANAMKRLRKKGLPVIIPINIPQKWGEAEPGESPVVKLIRRAIGYQIKLKR